MVIEELQSHYFHLYLSMKPLQLYVNISTFYFDNSGL